MATFNTSKAAKAWKQHSKDLLEDTKVGAFNPADAASVRKALQTASTKAELLKMSKAIEAELKRIAENQEILADKQDAATRGQEQQTQNTTKEKTKEKLQQKREKATDKKNADKEKVKGKRDLENALEVALAKMNTRESRSILRERRRAAEDKARKEAKASREDFEERRNDMQESLSQQLLEVTELLEDKKRSRGNAAALKKLSVDLKQALQAILEKDHKKFAKISETLEDLEENYGLKSPLAKHLKNLDETTKALQEHRKAKKERRSEMYQSIADSLGFGKTFALGKKLFQVPSTIRGAIGGVKEKLGDYGLRARRLKEDVSDAVPIGLFGGSSDAVAEEAGNIREAQQTDLLKRQVKALEELSKAGKRVGKNSEKGSVDSLKRASRLSKLLEKASGLASVLGRVSLALAPLAAMYGVTRWAANASMRDDSGKMTSTGAALDAAQKAAGGQGLKPLQDMGAAERLNAETSFGSTLGLSSDLFGTKKKSLINKYSTSFGLGTQYSSEEAAVLKKNLGLDVPEQNIKKQVPTVTAPAPLAPTGAGAGRGSMGMEGTEPVPGGMSLSDAKGKLFKTNKSGEALDNVNPALQSNFTAMAAEFKERGGRGDIVLNSGFRSAAEQARLYAQDPSKAAPPGKSAHGMGLALDINSDQANQLDQMGLLSKYGFARPVKGEAWHLQAAGSAVALAKAGAISADSAADQNGAQVVAASKPVPASVAPAPPVMTASAAEAPTQTASASSGGTSVKGSTQTIPTFSYMDNGFFIMNTGMMTA